MVPNPRKTRPLASLNYEALGNRQNSSVVLLHGFMGSSTDWRDVTAALDGRFRFVVVDLPGHGASTGLLPGAYTVEGAARSVLEVLDEAEVDRTAVVGYSMGGRLALYLALRHPDRCAGIFLESASPGLEGEADRAARREADEERALRLESGDFEGFLRGWYQQPLFASLAREETLLERTMEARRKNDPAELAKSLRGTGTGSQPSLWGELPNLRVPALAVAGELDEKFVGISRRMEDLSPPVRAVVVPGVGHNVRVEAPGEYPALLKSFLEGL